MFEEMKRRWYWWAIHKATRIARFAINNGRKYMSGTNCVNLGQRLYNISMDNINNCPYSKYMPGLLKGAGSGLGTIIIGYRKLGLYYEANTLQRIIEDLFAN